MPIISLFVSSCFGAAFAQNSDDYASYEEACNDTQASNAIKADVAKVAQKFNLAKDPQKCRLVQEKLSSQKVLDLSKLYLQNAVLLRGLGQVDSLDLSSNNFDSTDLSILAELENLKVLYLNSNAAIRDLSPLYSLANLIWLSLGGVKLQATDADFINFSSRVNIGGLEILNFTKLEDITYSPSITLSSRSKVSVKDMREIADLKDGELVNFGAVASDLLTNPNLLPAGNLVSLMNWYLQYQNEIEGIYKTRLSGSGAYGAWVIEDFYGFKLKNKSWVILQHNVYGE
ncbi:MAG: hypothetical protein KBD78_10185 [Oligoflexales bacterium]|nr:hypothetical protein [Oligoflexales bacterium]